MNETTLSRQKREMNLLTFAHRGEAQTFLKNMDLKADTRLQGLYTGNNISLLITGEGVYETITSVSMALGLLENINSIINLGICGSVNKDIPLKTVFQIRTIYGENEFKSFSISTHDKIDLITTRQRVLTLPMASELAKTADLVDREAWANGYVAKKCAVSFNCIKLVSDHISDAQVCELIKDLAQEYSDRLFEYYTEKFSLESTYNLNTYKIHQRDEFYFTVSQKRQYQTLTESLKSKYKQSEEEILNSISLNDLAKKELLPKDRTRELLILLEELIYPFKTIIKNKLNTITQDLSGQGAQFKFDRDLEQKSFILNAKIDSEHKKKVVTKLLEDFSWNKFEEIMNGEFDV